MFTLLNAWSRSAYPLHNALALASNTIPLIEKDPRVPFPPVEEGSLCDKWNDFAERVPSGKFVKLVHGWLPTCAMGLGSDICASSPRVINIDFGLEKFDEDAAMFFCKHEFAHIKHNDTMVQHGTLLTINVAASYFCSAWYTPFLVGLAVGVIAERVIGRGAEDSADNFAITHASEEELRGAVRFFEAMIQVNNELCPLTSLGNRVKRFYLEFSDRHSTNADRKSRVENALKLHYGYSDEQLDGIKNDVRLRKLKAYALSLAQPGPGSPLQAAENAFLRASAIS